MEEWRDFEGYEGYYQISGDGRVRSIDRVVIGADGKTYHYKSRILKQVKARDGYMAVQLFRDSRCKTYKIHRMVALTFIPNPNNKPEVNHIDGDKSNNHASNLEWCTRSENIKHAVDHGLNSPIKAIEATKKKVEQIDSEGNTVKRWDTMTDAANEMGVHISNVSSCCHGRLKSTGGYSFRFTKEGEEQCNLDR